MSMEKRLVLLARRPEAAGALFYLANRAIARGSLDYAEAMLRRALKELPNDAGLWNNFGVVLARSGRVHEAADAFATALGLRADYEDARANLHQAAAHASGGWRLTRTRLKPAGRTLAAAA